MIQRCIVDNTRTFSKNTWIVSVLNTGSKMSGHSILLVEGIVNCDTFLGKEEKLFIGQYDIKYTPYSIQESSVNSKGYVSEITIFEEDSYGRNYSLYTSSSHEVSSQKANEMIKAIKEDKATVSRLEHMIQSDKVKREFIDSDFIKKDNFLEYEFVGNNCANWCIDKLAIAGVQVHALYGKPEKIAGGCTLI